MLYNFCFYIYFRGEKPAKGGKRQNIHTYFKIENCQWFSGKIHGATRYRHFVRIQVQTRSALLFNATGQLQTIVHLEKFLWSLLFQDEVIRNWKIQFFLPCHSSFHIWCEDLFCIMVHKTSRFCSLTRFLSACVLLRNCTSLAFDGCNYRNVHCNNTFLFIYIK